MNKILVKVFFPQIDKWYDIWIPSSQKISSIIIQMVKGINELNNNIFQLKTQPILYNRYTGEYYDLNITVQNTNIINGSELILI